MLKVSVVIPLYNVEKYLITCIESVLNQTYKDFEIILVDDGSSDGSGHICDEYEKKYKQIITIHTNHVGASSARNAGIKRSSGDYVYFADADDYLDPNLLEKCVNAALETGSNLIKIGYIKIADDGNFLYEKNIPSRLFRCKTIVEKINFICDQLLSYNLPIQPWSCFIKRKFLLENNLFFVDRKLVFSEDVCFSIMSALKLDSIYTLSGSLYYFRKRIGSAMWESKKEKNRNIEEYNNMSKLIYNSCCSELTEEEFSLIHHNLLIIRMRKIKISQLKKEIKKITEKEYFYTMNRTYYRVYRSKFCSRNGIYMGLKNKSFSKLLVNNNYFSYLIRSILIALFIKPLYILNTKLKRLNNE